VFATGVFLVSVYKSDAPISEVINLEPVPADDVLATSTYVTSTSTENVSTSTQQKMTATSTRSTILPTTVSKAVIEDKIRVLIVAGHEPTYGGAEYRTLKERDMTLRVSKYLSDYFRANPKFEAIVVRDEKGWNPVFSDYFKVNENATKEFYESHMAKMEHAIEAGTVTEVIGVPHNKAPEDVALHLYGVSRWADAHDIDLILNIHFNDVPRGNASMPGKYSGIAMYVPERQYTNSSTSMAIAQVVFPYLLKNNAVSTLPTESGGIIEDQELIALGKYNTLKAPSILIEYGYIYENQFQNGVNADATFKNLALETYKGIVDYFGN
jgi:N-acetylmuramoyl-L-alanine amidase